MHSSDHHPISFRASFNSGCFPLMAESRSFISELQKTSEDYFWQSYPISFSYVLLSIPLRLRPGRDESKPALAIPPVPPETNPNTTCNSARASVMVETNPNPTCRVHEEKDGDGEHVIFFNATRHEHELCLLEGLQAYRCSGCHEYGANIGYKCKLNGSSSCENFTLHEACATIPDVFQHPFRRLFKFRPKTRLRHHCAACRDVLKGYVFERPDHLRLHPLCMLLPENLHYGGHAHHQLNFVTGDLKGEACACCACDKNIKAGSWRYQCEKVTCNFCVDLSCAKTDFYGLSLHGITRVAPINRNNGRFRSKPSSSGSWAPAALLEGTIKGTVEAVVADII